MSHLPILPVLVPALAAVLMLLAGAERVRLHRRIGLGAAGDIAVEKLRNPPPRGRLEIVEREVFLQGPWHGVLGAGNGSGRGGSHSG